MEISWHIASNSISVHPELVRVHLRADLRNPPPGRFERDSGHLFHVRREAADHVWHLVHHRQHQDEAHLDSGLHRWVCFFHKSWQHCLSNLKGTFQIVKLAFLLSKRANPNNRLCILSKHSCKNWNLKHVYFSLCLETGLRSIDRYPVGRTWIGVQPLPVHGTDCSPDSYLWVCFSFDRRIERSLLAGHQ